VAELPALSSPFRFMALIIYILRPPQRNLPKNVAKKYPESPLACKEILENKSKNILQSKKEHISQLTIPLKV